MHPRFLRAGLWRTSNKYKLSAQQKLTWASRRTLLVLTQTIMGQNVPPHTHSTTHTHTTGNQHMTWGGGRHTRGPAASADTPGKGGPDTCTHAAGAIHTHVLVLSCFQGRQETTTCPSLVCGYVCGVCGVWLAVQGTGWCEACEPEGADTSSRGPQTDRGMRARKAATHDETARKPQGRLKTKAEDKHGLLF